MFYLNRVKFSLSLIGKTRQKPTKITLTVCSMLITFLLDIACVISGLIIKITISSIVIGLKNPYAQLFDLPSCYRTVCYWTVQ